MFSARGPLWFQPPAPSGGFGNNALYPGNTDQFLSVNSTTDLITWKATTGFTIEYWFYATAWPGTINPGPGNQDAGGTNYWSFGPAVNGRLEFYFWSPGTTYITTADSLMSLNTWHNISAVMTSVGSTTTVSLYIDGVRRQVRLGTGSGSGTLADTQTTTAGATSAGTPFRMGRYGSNRWTDFYMDNLRVSNINRYSGASYTVASSPFTSDANTQLLMICDGTPGSTTFTDSSSFNRTVTNNVNRVTISSARANHS
jgi:hypothetical protein